MISNSHKNLFDPSPSSFITSAVSSSLSSSFFSKKKFYFLHSTPMQVLKVYTGWSSPGQLMRYYSHLPSRFIVIPRHKGARHQDIKFLDADPFHVSYPQYL